VISASRLSQKHMKTWRIASSEIQKKNIYRFDDYDNVFFAQQEALNHLLWILLFYIPILGIKRD
jgi:hypothetical protein